MSAEPIQKKSLWSCAAAATVVTVAVLLIPWPAVGVGLHRFFAYVFLGLGALLNAYPASYVWVGSGVVFASVFIFCGVAKSCLKSIWLFFLCLVLMFLSPVLRFNEIDESALENEGFSAWVSGDDPEQAWARARGVDGQQEVVKFAAMRACEKRQKLSVAPNSIYALTIDGVPAEKAQCGILNHMKWVLKK